jgi:O-antigen ligase
MGLILSIDFIVVSVLAGLTLTKGIERALPFFAFVVVLVPWQSKIALPGLFDLNTQRLALMTLIGLYILTRMSRSRALSTRRVPLKALMLLSVGWLALSTANSVVPTTSVKTVVAEAVEYYLMYIILVRTVSSKETIHRILFGIVAALMVCAVLGVGEAKFGLNINDWFPKVEGLVRGDSGPTYGVARGYRIETTFPHPIHYGAALAIGIPLALYLISVSRSAVRRGLLWGGIALMSFNILMTGSRGPWLALGLSLACVFLLCRGRLRWYLPAIVFMGLLLFVAKSNTREYLVRIYDATLNPNTSVGSSFDYRFALISVSAHALAENMDRALLGYGPGSFNSLHLKGPFQSNPEFLFWSCDSAWIKFAVETGYVGLLFMAMLLLAPAFMAFRDYLRFRKPEATLSGVLLVSLASFYFMMISVALYDWAQIGFLLWMLISLSVAHSRLSRRKFAAVTAETDFEPEFTLDALQPVAYCATPGNGPLGRQHQKKENEDGLDLAPRAAEGV